MGEFLSMVRKSKALHFITRSGSKATLAALALLLPLSVFAQSAIDGTWKTNPAASKPSNQPIVFAVVNGFYDCDTCVPKIHVKADGNDQPVTALAHVTVAVKEIDPRTIEIVVKKDAKTISDQVRHVSEDGQTLHVKETDYVVDDPQPVLRETTAQRVGDAMRDANATSGSWRTIKLSSSDNGLLVTYQETGNRLSMSTPTDVSWTANFDGQFYPVHGSYSADSVSLKKLAGGAIEMTSKQGGKIVRVDTMTISPDGRSMTTVSENKVSGRVSTWVATKQ